MTGFFIMKKIENKEETVEEKLIVQKNYEELKKKADLTEKFVIFANRIEIDDKDIPKTEKGLETKAKELIEKLFSAASLQRWNDHPRPIELTELDKQAHKMLIAYILARLEEDNGQKINWAALIEVAIFEFYHRIVLTDLKPRVFHKLMQEKEKELNAYVANHLQKDLQALSKPLYERFCDYFGNKTIWSKEKAILKKDRIV